MTDVVVGLVPPSADQDGLKAAFSRILPSIPALNAAVVYPSSGVVEAGLPPQERWQFLPDPRLTQDRTALAQSLGQSFRAIFEVAVKLEARACAIITSDLGSVTAEWIEGLINPVIQDGFDLVTPCYTRSPFDGVINRAIVYPMVRALYGKRVRNPMGPDFGISVALVDRMGAGIRPRMHPLVSLVAEAIASDMKICQAHLGARLAPSLDWGNLSPFLSQVLAALFLDVERFAPVWQRARGSAAIPEFGTPVGPDQSAAVDPATLIQRFQAAARGMVETWGTILPPSTLVDLRKLARQSAAHFQMSDEIWARIVYDFALAHRIRMMNRDEVLRAFTPIYMGWAASYALEVANVSPDAAEQRIEELCVAFERLKPYFVSRWRWPDRFTP